MTRLKDWGLRVLFVDQITLTSLLHLLALGRSLKEIWHFEPIPPSTQRLLRVARRIGFIRANVIQIEHNIGQVRDDSGEGEYIRLLRDARAICRRIRREHLANNPLIKAMESKWEISKILLYFEKLAEQEVKLECLRIGLVAWLLRTQLHLAPTESVLLIARRHCFSYLQPYAASKGIRLIGYGPPRSRSIVKAISRMFRIFVRISPALFRALRSPIGHRTAGASFSPGYSNPRQQPHVATIAVRYWHRKLSFDLGERSEFFWLRGSSIPYPEVLLYDFVADEPLDATTLNEFSSRGVTLLGRGTGIPAWYPTRLMFGILFKTLTKIGLSVLSCLARRHRVSPYFVRKLIALASEYAYWYDFYAAHGVRINVGTLNTSVGQVLALDALHGVSTAYQYSVSNIISPTTLLSAGENVQFVFSPVFDRQWRSIEAPVDSFVHTGYIYDSAFMAVRSSHRIIKTRKKLQDKGARFILCFFDENSMNRWDIYASDEDAANDYEYLLKWVLADLSVGIVFKPKKSLTFFQRISRLSGLIEQAKETGRCTFLTSQTIVGDIYPAEAALMADMCIGKLSGSTAALEARLVGVPTLLIDTEGFHSHPFYTWGHDRVVFKDWESLRVAVENYRNLPEVHPELGDWSPALSQLDPFRDGEAGVRIGFYIRWVYDALKRGASKQAALSEAAEEFERRWGDGHITFR